jgi:formate--tetrahydrofolate ligase
MATRTALRLADYVVTEAGFGADLGAEKFIDIKCRASGLRPSAAVVVATVRALKYHGGVAVADLGQANVPAVTEGMANLRRHLHNIRDVYGLPAVVALNRFPTDTDDEVAEVLRLVEAEGFRAYEALHYSEGAAGAQALARGVLEAIEGSTGEMRFVYSDEQSLAEKAEAVARSVYDAGGVTFSPAARKALDRIEAEGHGSLPVCMAKTPASFSTDASVRGAPSGHTVDVREVRLNAGAGFVVMVTGSVMTMPGLPKAPAAHHIDIDDDGRIVGLS